MNESAIRTEQGMMGHGKAVPSKSRIQGVIAALKTAEMDAEKWQATGVNLAYIRETIEAAKCVIDRVAEVGERDEQSDELHAAMQYIQYGDEHAADECPYEDECPLGHCSGDYDEGYGPCEQHSGDRPSDAALRDCADEIRREGSGIQSLPELFGYPHDLHFQTVRLLQGFFAALAAKLYAAQNKYGYTDGWRDAGWMEECRVKLREHLEKGDPRDVAAYCAFLWFHNEPTRRDGEPCVHPQLCHSCAERCNK